jgi:hypothetical protein
VSGRQLNSSDSHQTQAKAAATMHNNKPEDFGRQAVLGDRWYCSDVLRSDLNGALVRGSGTSGAAKLVISVSFPMATFAPAGRVHPILTELNYAVFSVFVAIRLTPIVGFPD